MEVLESHLLSSIKDLYDDEDMIFQRHLAPTHKKGQDIATGVEHSSAQLVRQQSQPKHY